MCNSYRQYRRDRINHEQMRVRSSFSAIWNGGARSVTVTQAPWTPTRHRRLLTSSPGDNRVRDFGYVLRTQQCAGTSQGFDESIAVSNNSFILVAEVDRYRALLTTKEGSTRQSNTGEGSLPRYTFTPLHLACTHLALNVTDPHAVSKAYLLPEPSGRMAMTPNPAH